MLTLDLGEFAPLGRPHAPTLVTAWRIEATSGLIKLAGRDPTTQSVAEA